MRGLTSNSRGIGINEQNRTFRPRGPSSAVTLKRYRVYKFISTAVGVVMTGVVMTGVDGLGGK